MILCDDGHDEVAYENKTRNCPVCTLIKDIENLEEEIGKLNDELEDRDA